MIEEIVSGIIVILIAIYIFTKFRKAARKRKLFHLKSSGNKYYIQNLNRSVIGVGGAGSGKTYSLINPLLSYCIANRGCVTFDPKGELSPLINKAAKKHDKPIVNFSLDNNYDKINPLTLCEDKSDIIDFSSYFLSGIVGQPKEDAAKYFFNSAKSVLVGVIVFLKNNYKSYCTIPHIVALFLTARSEDLITLLSSDKEASRAATILNTVKKDPKLLGSILSTFSAFFSSLDTPRIFRNLVTENVLELPNNPSKPSVVNLIFNLQKRDLYTPIYSSIVGLLLKKMNIPGQHESAVIIDEFTVLSIPNFVNIPETARSNGIACVLAIQDLSQLITRYGKEEASSIISNMGSQFLFRTTNPETLDHFEKMLGVREVKDISKNKSTDLSFKTSKNIAQKEKNILRKEEIIQYKPGQCFGIISEGSHAFIESKRINGNHYVKKLKKDPEQKLVSQDDDESAYRTVYLDVERILNKNTTTINPKKFNI